MGRRRGVAAARPGEPSLGFPPVTEQGDGHGHDNAPKEETAPTGVVVARSGSHARFLLGLVHQNLKHDKLGGRAKLPPWAITMERG